MPEGPGREDFFTFLFCELIEDARVFRQIWQEHAKVMDKPQEAAHLFGRGGRRPVQDPVSLSFVGLDTVCRDAVSQEADLCTKQFGLLRVAVEFVVLKSI